MPNHVEHGTEPQRRALNEEFPSEGNLPREPAGVSEGSDEKRGHELQKKEEAKRQESKRRERSGN